MSVLTWKTQQPGAEHVDSECLRYTASVQLFTEQLYLGTAWVRTPPPPGFKHVVMRPTRITDVQSSERGVALAYAKRACEDHAASRLTTADP